MSFLALTNFASPFLANLVPAAVIALASQLLVGIPSSIKGTEIFYDVSGACTFILTVASGFIIPALRIMIGGDDSASACSLAGDVLDILAHPGDKGWRQLVVSVAVLVYALRCGFPAFFPSFSLSRPFPPSQ